MGWVERHASAGMTEMRIDETVGVCGRGNASGYADRFMNDARIAVNSRGVYGSDLLHVSSLCGNGRPF